jgi:large conductance mechanosensitive channel
MLKGFKEFILRGNALDLAVGVVIGAAFGTVVTSLVEGLLTPLIGAIVKSPDFSKLAFTINGSVFMYGAFINALISFVLVAAAVYFFVIVPMNTIMKRTGLMPSAPEIKECAECLSKIALAAKRCAYCATPQQ